MKIETKREEKHRSDAGNDAEQSVVSYTSGVEAYGQSFAGGYGTVAQPIAAPMSMPMGQPMQMQYQQVQPAPMQYQMPMAAPQPMMQYMQQPAMQFAAPQPQYQVMSAPAPTLISSAPRVVTTTTTQGGGGNGPYGGGANQGQQGGNVGRFSYRQLTRGGAMAVASDQFLRAPEPVENLPQSAKPTTGPPVNDNYSCGIKLRELPGKGLQVVRLTMGSSAMLSNQVREGDFLTSIDGYQIPNSNVDLEHVKRLLNGIRGSMVQLGLRRVDGEQYQIELARNVRSAKKAMNVMLDKTLAFLNKPSALDKTLIKPLPAHYGRSGVGIAPGQTQQQANPNNNRGMPQYTLGPPQFMPQQQFMAMPQQQFMTMPQQQFMTMPQQQFMPAPQPQMMTIQQPQMMMAQPRMMGAPAFGGFGGPSFPMYGGSVAADSFTPSIAIGDYAGEEEM